MGFKDAHTVYNLPIHKLPNKMGSAGNLHRLWLTAIIVPMHLIGRLSDGGMRVSSQDGGCLELLFAKVCNFFFCL